MDTSEGVIKTLAYVCLLIVAAGRPVASFGSTVHRLDLARDRLYFRLLQAPTEPSPLSSIPTPTSVPASTSSPVPTSVTPASTSLPQTVPTEMLPRLTVLDAPLFMNKSSQVVVAHRDFAPPNRSSTTRCISVVTDIVASSADPTFYYSVQDVCVGGEGTLLDPAHISHVSFSLWRGNSSSTRGSSGASAPLTFQDDDRSLITYWWPHLVPNGTRVSNRTTLASGSVVTNRTIMATPLGLDIASDGTHLVLITVPVVNIPVPLLVASVSAVDGSRLSIPLEVDGSPSFTMDPAKSRLYIAEVATPLRFLSPDVDETGLPTAPDQLSATGQTLKGVNFSDVTFTSQSGIADGSCLYFTDDKRLWGIDPRTYNSSLVAGSGADKVDDGDGDTAAFNNLHRVVTTPDGCNVFVTETGEEHDVVRWIKLDSPCSKAKEVKTVARYQHGTAAGLALHFFDGQLRLYVGTHDGLIIQLEIDQSRLQACAGSTTPPGWTTISASPSGTTFSSAGGRNSTMSSTSTSSTLSAAPSASSSVRSKVLGDYYVVIGWMVSLGALLLGGW
ncbi:hypothetical protein CBR_g50612 [Chara braunii]|uniref:Uncharacterized protein n=1 Tax=Chara braunii TaxID=69332 RepID=A0A388M701_CHABU|nr:hypothetical protein CBR_g50612 [Chara braunii]|eukprot:GBG90364.1 hypothetical protein CBR_g50612 [Chara braunii]